MKLVSKPQPRQYALLAVVLILILAAFSQGPVGQDPRYHDFADQRTLLGISNGLNVLSNIGFVLAGAWGLLVALRALREGRDRTLHVQYLLFFAGVFLSGIGSTHYHLDPTNRTLVWDRLPMSLAFMALLATAVSECIGGKTGAALLLPMLAIGMFSVLYWSSTESAGHGDLRLYGVVQFLPVVLVPLMLVLYRPAISYAIPLWSLVSLYGIAKVFELLDKQVFTATGISGHTMKHLVAALGAAAIARMLAKRREVLTKGKRCMEWQCR